MKDSQEPDKSLLSWQFGELVRRYNDAERVCRSTADDMQATILPRYIELLKTCDEERARRELVSMPQSVTKALMADAFIQKFKAKA